MWERAWANRMALFLRRWAARQANADQTPLLGPLPKPQILVTHDVDAVRKGWSVRAKQSAFHLFNCARRTVSGDFRGAADRLGCAARFAFSRADYWRLDELLELERAAGVSSCFMLYGRAPSRRTGALRLLDPDYDVAEEVLAHRLRALSREGHAIGLHPSFATWNDARAMREERERVERACGAPVTSCRQHWLKFSWQRTWAAQAEAGLKLDMTLGFNDRPGFRNGAALRFAPWDHVTAAPMAIESVPLLLMDSQLYDYAHMDDRARAAAIRHWIGEVAAVRGAASVIWHPHTLSPDYGWREGFRMLLAALPAGTA
jgi:hypothetical protein